jgi:hypothetical protein
MRALVTLVPPGTRWSEGEKRCLRKMIGGKTGHFGEQDKVHRVGMTTAPKLKTRASDRCVGDKPFDGTNIHKIGC